MKYILYFITIFYCSFVNAKEPCNCEDYRHLVPIAEVTSQVLHSLDTLHPEGRVFLNPLRNKNDENRLKKSKSLIPKQCWNKLFKRNDNKIKLISQQYIDPRIKVVPIAKSDVDFIFTGYNSIVYDLFYACIDEQKNRGFPDFNANLYCNNNLAQEVFNKTGELLSGDPYEVLSFLSNNNNNGAEFSLSDIKIMRVYHNMLQKGSLEESLTYLSEVKSSFTKQQKLQLVSLVGEGYSAVYDHEKSKKGIFNEVSVSSYGECNRSIKQFLTPDVIPKRCGVCREHGAYQAQMLKTMGFKKTWIISYANTNGIFHANVIAQDPDNPYVAYRVNYDEIAKLKNGDVRTLFYSTESKDNDAIWSDFTVKYKVYRPEGPIAAQLQSEMGKFLTEAAGFDIYSLDPLAQSRSSFLASDYTYGKSSDHQVRAGVGSDGLGNRSHFFVGGTHSYGEDTYFPGKIGYVIDYTTNNPILNSSAIPIDSLILGYVQLEQNAVTPEVSFNKIKVHAKETLIAIGSLAKPTSGYWKSKSKPVSQSDVRANTEIVIENKNPYDRLQNKTKLGVQLIYGLQDVREQNIAYNNTITDNHLYVSSETAIRLGESLTESVYFINKVVADTNAIGTRARFEFGFLSKKYGGSYTFSGGDYDKSTLIQDTSVIEHGLTGFYSPYKDIRITASGFTRDDDISGGRAFMEYHW